jgi:hypothetical protein
MCRNKPGIYEIFECGGGQRLEFEVVKVCWYECFKNFCAANARLDFIEEVETFFLGLVPDVREGT